MLASWRLSSPSAACKQHQLHFYKLCLRLKRVSVRCTMLCPNASLCQHAWAAVAVVIGVSILRLCYSCLKVKGNTRASAAPGSGAPEQRVAACGAMRWWVWCSQNMMSARCCHVGIQVP